MIEKLPELEDFPDYDDGLATSAVVRVLIDKINEIIVLLEEQRDG